MDREADTDQGRLIDRRTLIAAGLATGLVAALGPLAEIASAATTTVPDAQPVVDALAAALLPSDVAANVSAGYGSLLSSLPADARALVQRSLAEIGTAMSPVITKASPVQVKAALNGWIPRPRIQPPPTAGDPALMRQLAMTYKSSPDPGEPSTWALARACPFNGDLSYQATFEPSSAQLVAGARVGFVTYLLDLLIVRTRPAANDRAVPLESTVNRLG